MKTALRAAATLVLLGAAGCASAQTGVPAPPTPAASARPAAAAAPVQQTVVEDDGVRIEETRVRGLVQRIVVQSKVAGAAEYEIQVAPAGRDPTQERGGAGRRAWTLLRF